MRLHTFGVAIAALALALGLSACSEKPQVRGETGTGTRVTWDTEPWQGGPLPFQTSYTRGDQKSWEEALKLRLQGQNEYIRIGDK